MAKKPAWMVRMDRAEARAKRFDAWFDQRMKHFKKLAQIDKQEMVELRRSQRLTEASLRAFLASRRRGKCPFCRQELLRPSDAKLRAYGNSRSRTV